MAEWGGLLSLTAAQVLGGHGGTVWRYWEAKDPMREHQPPHFKCLLCVMLCARSFIFHICGEGGLSQLKLSTLKNREVK